MAVIAAWSFPSSRGTTNYETTLDSDGTLSCNCPGYVFKRRDQVRACTHTRKITPFVPELLDGRREPSSVHGGIRPSSTANAPTPAPMTTRRKRIFDFTE